MIGQATSDMQFHQHGTNSEYVIGQLTADISDLKPLWLSVGQQMFVCLTVAERCHLGTRGLLADRVNTSGLRIQLLR